jgi:hypothetical protein
MPPNTPSPPEHWHPLVKSVPERLAILEERLDNVRDDVTDTKRVVSEIHEIILKGKGAKWAIVTLVGLLSGFFSVLAHKYLPFLK